MRDLVALIVVGVLVIAVFAAIISKDMARQADRCTERGGDPQYVRGEVICFAKGVILK